jgi:hypothetical protein
MKPTAVELVNAPQLAGLILLLPPTLSADLTPPHLGIAITRKIGQYINSPETRFFGACDYFLAG